MIKYQVSEVFKDLHAQIETEIGKLLKCIHINNEGEYSSKIFNEYCSKHIIKHQKTIPHILQYY